jgi:hypothetical protein
MTLQEYCNVDALMSRIADAYESLPKQLKTIAKYREQNRRTQKSWRG